MQRGPPRHHSNPFLVPGNPRPERAPRFPPQKPGRQPIANIPQAVPVKSSKPLVPTGKSLAQALKENEHFSTLYTALKAADLITTLEKTNTDYTIFAPTNAAFDKVSQLYKNSSRITIYNSHNLLCSTGHIQDFFGYTLPLSISKRDVKGLLKTEMPTAPTR